MDYYYYDKDDNMRRLNLHSGNEFEKKVNNDRLISIFKNHIDNGDGIVDKKELSIFKQLMDIADSIESGSSNNKSLENDELARIEEMLQNGEIEISENGKVNVKSSRLTSTVKTKGKNGYEIIIQDMYKKDLAEDENAENIILREDFEDDIRFNMLITLIDKKGNVFQTKAGIEHCDNLLDFRRVKKIAAEYMGNMPKEKIEEIINNNVERVDFEILDEANCELYQVKPDEDAFNIIGEASENRYATIFSNDFLPPKREYIKEREIVREDGFKFKVSDTSETTGELKITTPSGKEHTLKINSDMESRLLHEYALPRLEKVLEKLPPSTIDDLVNEITTINFNDNNENFSGWYFLNSNVLNLKFSAGKSSKNDIEVLVHELGHALDNINNTYSSLSPEFKEDFDELHQYVQNYIKTNGEIWSSSTVNGFPHAAENTTEMFAAMYALNETGLDSGLEALDYIAEQVKDSDKPEDKRFLEIYRKLQIKTLELTRNTRLQTSTPRADNKYMDIVNENWSEIAEDVKLLSKEYSGFPGSTMSFANLISYDEEDFKQFIECYSKIFNSDFCSAAEKSASTRVFEKIKQMRSQVEKTNP